MNISKRSKSIKTSPVRKLIPYQEEAIRKGKKVYHLNIGQPDLETPKEFFDFINKSEEKVLSYAHSKGNLGLRSEISNFYKENFDLNYTAEEILITTGGSEAILFALTAICDEGDEVVVSEPYYANYNSFFEMLQLNVKPVTASSKDGFHLPSKDEIIKAITPKTRAIMITNPGNPTGTVYTKEELQVLVDIALEYNIYILSDEVYRLLSYDNKKSLSLGIFKEAEENVIILDSISKTYSACGARIGSITSKNKKAMQEIYKLCQARLSVSTLDMIGAEGLYKTLKNDYFQKNIEIYEKRRDTLYQGLLKIEGVHVPKPEGAFYAMVDLPVDDSEKFAIWLLKNFSLDNETIMLTPAQGFYRTPGLGKSQVRISYCIDEKKLERALKILDAGLKEYNKL